MAGPYRGLTHPPTGRTTAMSFFMFLTMIEPEAPEAEATVDLAA